MSKLLSFESLDSKLGKNRPFLIRLSDELDNELHIVIADAIVGEMGEGLENIYNDKVRDLLQQSRPVNPGTNLYEIYFSNYIIYQIRNESYCSYDREEIRNG